VGIEAVDTTDRMEVAKDGLLSVLVELEAVWWGMADKSRLAEAESYITGRTVVTGA
jgi:hypothetical protein